MGYYTFQWKTKKNTNPLQGKLSRIVSGRLVEMGRVSDTTLFLTKFIQPYSSEEVYDDSLHRPNCTGSIIPLL